MKRKIIFLMLLFCVPIFSQNLDFEKVIDKIKAKLDKVNDYSAEVNIAVNMDFLKMPKSKAQIYFKKPDKFRMKSSSFAILPKAGVDFNPQRILDYDFTAEFIADSLIDDSKVSLYKIIPKADTLKFVSAILAVDENDMLIKQLNLFTENNAKITTNFKYGDQKEYALPSVLKVTIDFSQVEAENTNKRRGRKIPENFKGDITITYKDYKINQGIDDSFFEEDKEKDKSQKQ